jgi:hypothetical protein
MIRKRTINRFSSQTINRASRMSTTRAPTRQVDGPLTRTAVFPALGSQPLSTAHGFFFSREIASHPQPLVKAVVTTKPSRLPSRQTPEHSRAFSSRVPTPAHSNRLVLASIPVSKYPWFEPFLPHDNSGPETAYFSSMRATPKTRSTSPSRARLSQDSDPDPDHPGGWTFRATRGNNLRNMRNEFSLRSHSFASLRELTLQSTSLGFSGWLSSSTITTFASRIDSKSDDSRQSSQPARGSRYQRTQEPARGSRYQPAVAQDTSQPWLKILLREHTSRPTHLH